MKALKSIQKQFPQVDEVVDATKSIHISVTENDNKKATKKDPYGCAMVRACIRNKIADGAIIGIGYSYLIKGRKATRYKTSVSVAREIVSFDRSKRFEAGTDYILSKIAPSSRFDSRKRSKRPSGTHPKRHIHRTANIRVLRKFK